MNFRRFSFVSDYSDNEIDQSFKNLYPNSEIIEQRCTESINDRKSLILTTSGNRSAFQQVILERSFQQVIEHLPKEYYVPDYDPVTDHLSEISSWKEVDTVERFMSKIEDTDTDKDVIIGELTSMIDANYDELMSCMRKIQEVSYELKEASNTVRETRAHLNKGALLLNNGALRVKILNSRRRKYSSLLQTLSNLKMLKAINQQFTSSLTTEDFSNSVNLAVLVCRSLQKGNHTDFCALSTIKESVVRNLHDLRMRIDGKLNYLVCRNFRSLEYTSVITSYIILDYIQGEYTHLFESVLRSHWTSPLQNLAKFLCHFMIIDVETCMRTAATESLFRGHSRKSRRSSEVSRMSLGALDEQQLISSEVPLNAVLRKVSVEELPECIVRSCELILDVLQTYNMILKWHTSPFEEISADENEMVTLNLDDLENLRGAMEAAVQGCLSSLELEDVGSVEVLKTQLISKFLTILSDLYLCRGMLWEDISRRLIDLLKFSTFSNQVKLEDFVSMMSTLQSFSDFGQLFGQPKHSNLQSFLQEKSTSFFIYYHADSFQMMRAMLEAELWQSIPIGDTDEDNSLLCVLRSLAKDASKVDEHSPGSISHDYVDGLHVNTPVKTIRGPILRKNSKLFSNLFSSDVAASDPSLSVRKPKKAISIIVTQSSLHGVAKQVFKYLDILTSMPVNPAEVIDCMCQLFDFYLCEVFYGFISQEDQSRFLGSPTKMNSPPPDQEKEFQVIKMFVEKVLSENVFVKPQYEDDIGVEAIDQNLHNSHESSSKLESVKFQSLLSLPVCVQSASPSGFFALKERMVAAESCHFVAQVLREIKPRILPIVTPDVGAKFDQLVDNYVYAAEQLRSLIYKLMCPSLINQNGQILTAIVETQWDSRKPPERQHEWVDRIVVICRKVWEFMSQGDFPEMIQEQIWLEICQAVFDVTLEGFSRVRKCTAEGRAAMTLDLFALHEGLNKIHLCRPPRGKPYVDSYLRTFYLSEEEVMSWVQQNWQAYAYRHMHGLLQQTMSSMLNSKKLRDALQVLDNLYDVENNGGSNSSSSLSGMFSTRLRDESFSSLIGSKFRR